MSATTELDMILRGWLSEGAERAPAEPVRLAVDLAERASQRRPMTLLRWRVGAEESSGARSLIVGLAAAVLLVVLGLGIGIQTAVIRIPQPEPRPAPIVVPVPSNPVGPSATETAAPDTSAEPDRPSNGTEKPAEEAGESIFTASDGSFQIQLPDVWSFERGVERGPDPAAMYISDGVLHLSIRAADGDGTVRMCDEGAGPWETCRTLDESTNTLDELASAIGLTGTPEAGVINHGPRYSTMTLDSEPAKVESINAYEHPAHGQESVKYVVTVHDGRPFIVRFWTPSEAGIGPADELLAGFSFLDPEPPSSPEASAEPSATDLETFQAPDGSFVISLPVEWDAREGPDPGTLYLGNGRVSMLVRAGDEDGRIQTCDTIGSAPFESCPTITATTLQELADGIAVSEGQFPHLGPNHADRSLGGEPATSITVVSGVSPPIGLLYVVAVHDGRPFIVRARQNLPPDPLLDVLRVLEGFSFR